MTEDVQNARLIAARKKAGFETASDAARKFGWNENTYRSHENGERGLRIGVALKYAKAFDIDPSELIGLFETGVPTTSVVYLTGEVISDGSSTKLITTSEGLAIAKLSRNISDIQFGLHVIEDISEYFLRKGDLVLLSGFDKTIDELGGRLCFVKTSFGAFISRIDEDGGLSISPWLATALEEERTKLRVIMVQSVELIVPQGAWIRGIARIEAE